jgi:hypothetical protein
MKLKLKWAAVQREGLKCESPKCIYHEIEPSGVQLFQFEHHIACESCVSHIDWRLSAGAGIERFKQVVEEIMKR